MGAVPFSDSLFAGSRPPVPQLDSRCVGVRGSEVLPGCAHTGTLRRRDEAVPLGQAESALDAAPLRDVFLDRKERRRITRIPAQ